MAKDQLIIFDTTLRDGEQSPGASMTRDEKVRIAKALERLRVDVIEAGFAVASPGDFEAVKAVAEAITESTVCSLSRALDRDIEVAAEAIAPAPRRRIHTFIATSPIHMKHKLKLEPEQVIEQAVYAVKKARQYTDDVEFSAEDAGRSDIDFLARVFEAVIRSAITSRFRLKRRYAHSSRKFPMQTKRYFRCIATMILDWLLPIHWQLCGQGVVRWNAPSMA